MFHEGNNTVHLPAVFLWKCNEFSLQSRNTNNYPLISPKISKTEYNTIHMYSGIKSGRVLDGELLYTKILEVNLFETVCRQIQTN